ncbi:DUF3986 family protein [Finegoldia sp. BIOML-A3]|uniref:DUF2634 domain-containing protein n=1 Tax=unclassified Finegoldia TaxID=2619637 RepID=UPI0012B0551C|nr:MULTISPECIES: DUF2634 domain-containing protein [unclassified Finegoldia]MSA99621.1 DUF3986 family protein [Finegoldia sp. BIOML-A3]MSB93607.1 DUF3986 family protein [Finegoldia sp. BIOML-A4]
MAILPVSMSYVESVDEDEEILEREGFCEYAYDFENNELKTKDGKHYYVYGNEAMKIWIYKAMITNRFRHSAYTDKFGTEIYSLIGEVISSKFKQAEIKRYITEAVMVHPFMVSINKIDMTSLKSGLNVDVYYTTVFSDEIVRVSCQVRIE